MTIFRSETQHISIHYRGETKRHINFDRCHQLEKAKERRIEINVGLWATPPVIERKQRRKQSEVLVQ